MNTNPDGTWKNKPNFTDWKPEEVPDDAGWDNMDASERAIMRRMWPDPSRPKKMVADPAASGIDDGDPVMIDQDELLEREAYELNWCGC